MKLHPNSIKKALLQGIGLAILTLWGVSSSWALPPIEMLYCGNVTDAQEHPFRSGQFILRILEENGNPLWTSSSVTPTFSSSGDFCITLGRDTEPLTTSIFSGDNALSLEISFKGSSYSAFETFSPLTPLVYAPFAIVAANASSSEGSQSTSFVQGTVGPELPSGNLTLSTGDLIITQGDIQSTAGMISAASLSAISGVFSGSLTVDSGTLAIDAVNDRVGIGTTSPQTGLDVAKNVLITPTTTTGSGVLISGTSITTGIVLDVDAQTLTTGGNALRIKYDASKIGSSGKVFTIRDVNAGSDVFYVDGSGNVRASGTITLSSGSVSTTEIADSSVTTSKIVDATIATTDIADSAISSAKVASDAITSAKISDGTIAAGDLATSSVTTAKIASDAVNSSKISDGTITTDDISDATIANADISSSAAIALSKLASGSSAQIIVGNATGVPTYVTMSGDATISNAGALGIASNAINQDELAATITLADGDLFDLSSINASGTSEGLKLPQATDVSAATAEGQTSWDSDNDRLYIGTGSSVAGIVSTPFPAAIQTGMNGTDGSWVIYSEQGSTDYSVTINPHATMTQNVTYTLPANDGTAGDFLQSDGSGALSWTTGQSGNQGNAYNPNNFPSSPSALDDEFADGSLNVKWTVFQSTGLTATEANHLLKLTGTTHASDRIQGYFQTLPAGNFTAVAKLGMTAAVANYSGVGLALFQDATNNPNTSDICHFYIAANVSGVPIGFAVSKYSQFDTYSTDYYGVTGVATTDIYFRVRRNGTTLYFDFSLNGIGFVQVKSVTEATLGFTPAEIGLTIDNYNSGSDLTGYFDFFRYKNSDDNGLIGTW